MSARRDWIVFVVIVLAVAALHAWWALPAGSACFSFLPC